MKEARRASSFLGCLRPEGRGGEAALGGSLPPPPQDPALAPPGLLMSFQMLCLCCCPCCRSPSRLCRACPVGVRRDPGSGLLGKDAPLVWEPPSPPSGAAGLPLERGPSYGPSSLGAGERSRIRAHVLFSFGESEPPTS